MDSRRRSLSNLCAQLKDSNARNKYQVHAGLWLDKYISSQDRGDTASRSDLVQAVSDIQEPAIYKAFYQRWPAILEAHGAIAYPASSLGRIIVGLGNENVLEASLTLHRAYGVPYIPGSALKGLAASYVRQYLGHESRWQKGGEAHTILFGNTDESGYITFFDALYIPGTGSHKKALHPDVITVHHQNYYQATGNAAPTDWDNPIPVPFLSATGSYLIALAATDLEASRKWIELTFTILAGALRELGVGAKTSSGYGRLAIDGVPYIPPASRSKPEAHKTTPPPSSAPPVDPVTRQIAGYQGELNALPNNPSINNRINGYYQHWKKLKDHPQATSFARAIVEKIRLAGCEKNCREKAWYKELLAVIG